MYKDQDGENQNKQQYSQYHSAEIISVFWAKSKKLTQKLSARTIKVIPNLFRMKNSHFIASTLLFGLLAVVQPTYAATDTASTTTAVQDQVTTETAVIVTETENANPTYDGITVEVPTKAPTPFGQFWRSIKETIQLALAFDPNKKAELSMKFADEHMLFAQKALESKDANIKERAQKELERAKKLMEKAQANQEKALENPNKDTERLLKNRAAQVKKHEELLDQLETQTEAADHDSLIEFRAKINEQNSRLENAISNEKIPEDVRTKLEALKTTIEAHVTEIKEHVAQVQALQEAAKGGDEEAAGKIEDLKQQRIEQIKKDIEARKENLQQLQEKIKSLKEAADKGNKKAMEIMQKIQDTPELQTRLEEIDQKIEDEQNKEDEQKTEDELETKEENGRNGENGNSVDTNEN